MHTIPNINMNNVYCVNCGGFHQMTSVGCPTSTSLTPPFIITDPFPIPIKDNSSSLITQPCHICPNLQKEIKSLKTVITKFLEKYDKLKPHILSAFELAAIHGFPYKGETWEKELEELRNII